MYYVILCDMKNYVYIYIYILAKGSLAIKSLNLSCLPWIEVSQVSHRDGEPASMASMASMASWIK